MVGTIVVHFKSYRRVDSLDYRCKEGDFPMSASREAVPNHDSVFISETGGYMLGQESLK